MPRTDLILLHAPSVYDFRKLSILYGPISDLVPSTPIFEMYPIGFTTLAEYLERHGYRVRIVNLAMCMLQSPRFDAEHAIQRMHPLAFGIDLHWMPHAHGAIEVARLVRKYHPQTPILFGGFSASFFHEELIRRPEADFVLRGDSTEEPLRLLIDYLAHGGDPHPAPNTPAAEALAKIPNLTWQDAENTVHANPITYVPETLDHILLDYSYVIHAVVRYRDLLGFVPFRRWLRYPITAALTCRGCIHHCHTCGGSATTFREVFKRNKPAFRPPEQIAKDVHRIARFSRGPVFILGDIRQAGMEYAHRLLDALRGIRVPLMFELFGPAPRSFLEQMAQTSQKGFALEISPESHDEQVRAAFGRHYTNQDLETTIAHALEVGCQRLDLFFMIGLPQQTYDSVMDTVAYCEELMERFDRPALERGERPRVIPFISPFAPFLDPGSEVFMNPEAFGYRLLHRTLEEHRQALVAPSWKYVLNYETHWMDRDTIVAATYEAGLRFNRLKARYGLISPQMAEETERRIHKAINLSRQIDAIMRISDERRRNLLLQALKPQVDRANESTVCDKRELELPVGRIPLNLIRAAGIVLQQWLRPKHPSSPAHNRH